MDRPGRELRLPSGSIEVNNDLLSLTQRVQRGVFMHQLALARYMDDWPPRPLAPDHWPPKSKTIGPLKVDLWPPIILAPQMCYIAIEIRTTF